MQLTELTCVIKLVKVPVFEIVRELRSIYVPTFAIVALPAVVLCS